MSARNLQVLLTKYLITRIPVDTYKSYSEKTAINKSCQYSTHKQNNVFQPTLIRDIQLNK